MRTSQADDHGLLRSDTPHELNLNSNLCGGPLFFLFRNYDDYEGFSAERIQINVVLHEVFRDIGDFTAIPINCCL